MAGMNSDLHHNDLDRFRPAESIFDDIGLSYRPKSVTPSTRNNEDCAVPFTYILLNTGDVLVYIDIPILKNPRGTTDCEGVVPHNLKFYVHSEKLFALGDTKFRRLLLNQRKQKRWREARNPDEAEMKGVEFILDLTPDMEGDDRVFELAELSVTKGIVDWWAADKMHKITSSLVRGHDDICSCQQPDSTMQKPFNMTERISIVRASDDNNETQESPPSDQITLPPLPSDLLRFQAQGVDELFDSPLCYQIPDYCSFRHCNSIARLLLMIEGKGVKLNSAARVWTMVGISKIYECPSVVRDTVAQWIMSNTRFIEVLPEEALRIGFNLMLPQITKSAFRILVNEMALEEAAGEEQSHREKSLTIFGRRKEDPGDDKSNAIQHAARAFVERVKGQQDILLSPAVFDQWSIDGLWSTEHNFIRHSEWKKLRSIEHVLIEDNDGTFDVALRTLWVFMNALVYKINNKVDNLRSDSDFCRSAYQEMDKDRATYLKPCQFDQIQYILPGLTMDQRLLLPFFYNELGRQCENPLYWGEKSTHPESRYKYFSHLLRDVEHELQKLVDAKPTRGYYENWKILFSGADAYSTPRPNGRLVASPLIDLAVLEIQVRDGLKPITRAWERIDKGFVPQLNITRHMLLTLEANEMKFLPLWAGGNDDGTGGVFEDLLPPAELGPTGPGPAYHTGITVPSDAASLSESFVEDIRAFNIRGSTTAGSIAVHDSISTVYNPNYVIAADSSIAPSSYGGDDAEFAQAKYEVPADHQGIGQAVAMMVDDDPNGAYNSDEIEDDDSDGTLTELGWVSDDEDQEMIDNPKEWKGKEPMTADDDAKSVVSESDAKSMTTDSDNDSMVLV